MTVHREEHISRLDARIRETTARIDQVDQVSPGPHQANRLRDVLRHLLPIDPRPGFRNLQLTRKSGLKRAHHEIGRYRKPDTVGTARARQDGRVDPDEPSGGIDQRTTGVADIDGGVGLDEICSLAIAPGQGRHDPGGHRLADTQRVSDCEDEITDFEVVRVAHLERRQRLVRILQAKYGEIRNPVGEQDLCGILAPVREHDPNFLGTPDDVIRCDDNAVGPGQDPGTERVLHPPSGVFRKHVAEKLAEEGIGIKDAAACPHEAARVDADHGRQRLAHGPGKGEFDFGPVRRCALCAVGLQSRPRGFRRRRVLPQATMPARAGASGNGWTESSLLLRAHLPCRH